MIMLIVRNNPDPAFDDAFGGGDDSDDDNGDKH